eukprot:354302_1
MSLTIRYWYFHIIVIIGLMCSVDASFGSRSDKKEFLKRGREKYHSDSSFRASYSRFANARDIGGEEVYAQHNAEATDGEAFERPEQLGFKILDYGVEGFEESCIFQIISGKMSIKSAFGMMNSRDYAVDLTVENISPEDIECTIGTGTVFEQKEYTEAQNLAIKTQTILKVPAGDRFKIVLDAFCIDPSYRSPHGEPMNITPFIYTAVKENDSQNRVWEEVRNLRNDVTETLKMKQKKKKSKENLI